MKITMRKGVVLIMVLGLFWSPIIVSASWWNPLSWKVFSGVFNRASVGQDLKLNKNSTPTITTTPTTTAKNTSSTSVVEKPKKQPEQVISKTKPTNNDLALSKKDNLQKIPITNVATTSKEKDNAISLLQEQNDTLKKQLEVQQATLESVKQINNNRNVQNPQLPIQIPDKFKISNISAGFIDTWYLVNQMEKDGTISDSDRPLLSNRVRIEANKDLDPLKTKLFIDGEEKAIEVSDIGHFVVGGCQKYCTGIHFLMSPNMYSFMKPAPTQEQPAMLSVNIKLIFTSVDGEIITVKRFCRFDPTVVPMSFGTPECRHGEESWVFE